MPANVDVKNNPPNLRELINRIDELNECFPVVAPRVLTNIRIDEDIMSGFDTPASRVMAKYQVPVLLESLVSLGAFVRDESRRCGYRQTVSLNVSDETVSGPREAQTYFRDYARLFSERIIDGCPYRMLALKVPMNEEIIERVQKAILPVLGEMANLPQVEAPLGARFVFGVVREP